jgi:2-polyprenyl-3-methyl-5-hydroxy-6-metoxy-1,4-benzoquinol methylase
MSPPDLATEAAAPRKIDYLSPPAPVSMTDSYFEIASLDHFWVRRRFEVFRQLAGHLVSGAREIAEVGCGHGILQRQIEDTYGREVTGFDLNQNGLRHNLSRFSKVYCYDVYQMEPALRERYDLIFLWDVLEHIADEDRFLKALLFHLAPGGALVLNVPVGQWAFSSYDEAAGHVRRYSIRILQEAARRSQLEVKLWTYWGLPLVPTLILRKLWLKGTHDQRKIYSAGFDPRSTTINRMMRFVSKCEMIPQKFLGTSAMAVIQRMVSEKVSAL